MSKRQWLMVFGAVIIIQPLLGFPSEVDTVISVIIGLIIIAIAYFLKDKDIGNKSNSQTLPFTEQHPATNQSPIQENSANNIISTKNEQVKS